MTQKNVRSKQGTGHRLAKYWLRGQSDRDSLRAKKNEFLALRTRAADPKTSRPQLVDS
jgi:hypothetical protein